MQMSLTVFFNHFLAHFNQQNTTKVIFYYSMLLNIHSYKAYSENSNFFKVNGLSFNFRENLVKYKTYPLRWIKVPALHKLSFDTLYEKNRTKFNYELFICNNLNNRYWSWNYCCFWHINSHWHNVFYHLFHQLTRCNH